MNYCVGKTVGASLRGLICRNKSQNVFHNLYKNRFQERNETKEWN